MSESSVTYVENTFSDLMVVNSARISMGKYHNEFDPVKDTKLINYLVEHGHWSPLAHPHITAYIEVTASEILDLVCQKNLMAGFTIKKMMTTSGKGVGHTLTYKFIGSLWAFMNLASYLHSGYLMDKLEKWCPVSVAAFKLHCLPVLDTTGRDREIRFTTKQPVYTFHVKTPIFVARQLVKHQVGLVWNEISRRYVDSEPEFFVPDGWRKRAESKKQGSEDTLITYRPLHCNHCGWPSNEKMKEEYENMLHQGVCPEQARMVLPQSQMTEFYWTGTEDAFKRVVGLRCKPDAQKETREVAEQIRNLL